MSEQQQQPQRAEKDDERRTLDDHRPTTSERRSGRLLFQSCQSCHVGAPVGPPWWRDQRCVLGQTAGTMYGNDYPYSTALKQSGIVWDEENLDAFLANPEAVIPGTFMGNEPMTDPMERKMVIESLKLFCTSDYDDGGKIESITSAPTEMGSGGFTDDGSGPAIGGASSADAMSRTMWWAMAPVVVSSWWLLNAGRR